MLEEYEYRITDVAWSRREHRTQMHPTGQFMGVTELVIEALSPFNTAAQMLDKEQLCLGHGAREFSVVNIARKQVKVSDLDGRATNYRAGQAVPLFFGGSIAVDAIFA